MGFVKPIIVKPHMLNLILSSNNSFVMFLLIHRETTHMMKYVEHRW